MRRLATHILIYTTTRPFPHISWAADRAKAPDDRNIGPRLPRDSVKKDDAMEDVAEIVGKSGKKHPARFLIFSRPFPHIYATYLFDINNVFSHEFELKGN